MDAGSFTFARPRPNGSRTGEQGLPTLPTATPDFFWEDAFAATAQIKTRHPDRAAQRTGASLRLQQEREPRRRLSRQRPTVCAGTETASASFYHISPRMWEAELGLEWIGPRATNLDNSDELDGALNLRALLRWQPDNRRWSIALTASKHLTTDDDFAAGSNYRSSRPPSRLSGDGDDFEHPPVTNF